MFYVIFWLDWFLSFFVPFGLLYYFISLISDRRCMITWIMLFSQIIISVTMQVPRFRCPCLCFCYIELLCLCLCYYQCNNNIGWSWWQSMERGISLNTILFGCKGGCIVFLERKYDGILKSLFILCCVRNWFVHMEILWCFRGVRIFSI